MIDAALRYLGFAPDDYKLMLLEDGIPRIAEWYSAQPQPTPAEIEAARKPAALALVTERIKAERDRRKSTGVRVGEHLFHSDPDSRIQQLGLVMLGEAVPAVQWKTIGGAFVTMTPTLASAIFANTAARDIALFAAAEAHIAAAALLDDPLTYDFSTGWPE